LSGSLLEFGGIAANCVEFGTPNGETIPVVVLLSKTNVAVCGSPTVEGLSQVTLSPALISIFWGTNAVNGAVEFPPPACTLVVAVVVVFCALMTLKLSHLA